MRKSLFVTVMSTILCGVLWIFFLAATHQTPVLDVDEMIFIEGGTVSDPSGLGNDFEVAPFYIDKYEVTNIQFKKFRSNHKFPAGMEDYPVTNVTWEEAEAYAKWANKRLPTSLEWQLASGVNHIKSSTFESPSDFLSNTEIRRVGSLDEIMNTMGCYDLKDNVWEWVNDDSLSEKILPADQRAIINGWLEDEKEIGQRLALPAHIRSSSIGFRCARSE